MQVRSLPPVEYPVGAKNKAQAARLIAEENTIRVLRVQRAAVSGGFRFGVVAGTFFATQISAGYARQLYDVWNFVLGGSISGLVAGFTGASACSCARSTVRFGCIQKERNQTVGGADT
uniref:Uncharacterized protein n=1 Tax=Tetraselmis sp. GSL018 TaxID=582737 RepID=A0A061SD86_9CHLO